MRVKDGFVYASRRHWWSPRRVLLCCYGPCLRPGTSWCIGVFGGDRYVFCSPLHRIEFAKELYGADGGAAGERFERGGEW